MNRSVRSTLTLALGVVPFLALAGCGTTEDGGSASALTPIQGTSYVTIEPATTTTTLPVSTVAPEGGSVSAAAQTYTVAAGDSMYGIATKHGITLDELVAYNQITGDPGNFLLIAGQTVLQIPPGAKVPSAAVASTADPVVDPATQEGTVDPATATTLGVGCTYTIVAGDNPSRVASSFGITFDVLQSANPSKDFSTTFGVGEVIDIPSGADCSAGD